MRFSSYKNLTTPGNTIDFKEVIELVRSAQLKSQVGKLRSALESGDKKKYEQLKKNLPGFTPSGIFVDHRRESNLATYSGVIHLDLDKLNVEQLSKIQVILKEDPYCMGFYISPSGNGLKMFIRAASDAREHRKVYRHILNHYHNKLGVKPDPSCKDLARLCFFSYDPEAYYNPEASKFDEFQLSMRNNTKSLYDVLEEVKQRKEYKDGNRNNFVFYFAIACCHHRIPKSECIKFCSVEFDDIEHEIVSAVNSGYSGRYDYPKKTLGGFRGGKTTVIEDKLIDLGYSFRYNQVRQIVEVSKSNSDFIPMSDTVFNDVYRDLDASGHQFSSDKLKTVLQSSFAIGYDPFRSYFLQLPQWDEEDRIQKLADTVPVQNKAEWKDALTRWLIGLLACAVEEDKVNQQVLVLAGAQGIGKTTWLNRLIPADLKEYVGNGVVNPRDKDSLIQLSECILINIDELESLNSSQQGYLKELITKPHVRIRRPYARNAERAPRRASFSASVNNLNFLTDTTGNRRFLCFGVTGIIKYNHNIYLEQLWSQVYHLYKQGKKYWFDGTEIDHINVVNEHFYQASSEEELLLEHFERATLDDGDVKKLSATMLIQEICDKLNRSVRLSSVQMGKALTKHDFLSVKQGGIKKYLVKERRGR